MDDKDAPEANAILTFIADKAVVVLASSFGVAVLLTVLAFFLDDWDMSAVAVFGLIGTLWALALAGMIYVLSGNETARLLSEVEGLRGSMNGLVDDLAQTQTASELAAAKITYRGYIDALLEKLPAIPEADIVSVERLEPQGTSRGGNTPVIIQTQKRRYSVWRGGRNGGYHVTKLAAPSIEKAA